MAVLCSALTLGLTKDLVITCVSKTFSRGLGAPPWLEQGNVGLNLPEAFPKEDIGPPSLRHPKFTESQNSWGRKRPLV